MASPSLGCASSGSPALWTRKNEWAGCRRRGQRRLYPCCRRSLCRPVRHGLAARKGDADLDRQHHRLGGARCLPRAGLEIWFQGSPQRAARLRSEEHTSELQSLMRISYAVFCLKKKKKANEKTKTKK